MTHNDDTYKKEQEKEMWENLDRMERGEPITTKYGPYWAFANLHCIGDHIEYPEGSNE